MDITESEAVAGSYCYAPSYLDRSTSDTIRHVAPQLTINGGSIYLYKTMLFQIEVGRGIHIFDFSDPENSVKTGFYELPGCEQLSIDGNIIYANSYSDLIVVDISIITDPKIVNLQPFYFEDKSSQLPPERGYFECVDRSKGVVTGWNKMFIKSPECKY